MNADERFTSLPNMYADDDEIKRYAGLLDSLGVGLMVFSSNTTLYFTNAVASKLLVNSHPNWLNESGQPIAEADLPMNQALRSAHPVFDSIMALNNDGASSIVLSANAIPVLSKDDSIRRILLTLDDISHLNELKQEIGHLATHDPLTGAFNQRKIRQLLENEIVRAQRYGTPFTLAQLDIDLFRPLCEKHGSATGNLVLAGVGKLLCESAREMDVVGRVGNDEFMLIMPNVRLNDAIIGVERLRALIEEHVFTPDKLHVTISGGVTEYAGENATLLIERSNALLINARESGRNRLCQDVDIF